LLPFRTRSPDAIVFCAVRRRFARKFFSFHFYTSVSRRQPWRPLPLPA
jgi:hypothetical protein